MRLIIYKCDNCKKILSEGVNGETHLSINFDRMSGWVSPTPKGSGINQAIDYIDWGYLVTFKGVRQFCNGTCAGKYLDKIKNE